jgi:mannose-6-phosphate isomerase-like protein (cupin superfamily)
MSTSTLTRRTDLLGLLRALAVDQEQWLDRVRFSSEGRWYERLRVDDAHEVWLISWLPGEATGLHDHGHPSGAFLVLLGELVEHRVGPSWQDTARVLWAGDSRVFGPGYVHDVRNASSAPAVSLHAYSPRLTVLNRYDLRPSGLVRTASELADQW